MEPNNTIQCDVVVNKNPFSPKGVIGRRDFFFVFVGSAMVLGIICSLIISLTGMNSAWTGYFCGSVAILGNWIVFCLYRKRLFDIVGAQSDTVKGVITGVLVLLFLFGLYNEVKHFFVTDMMTSAMNMLANPVELIIRLLVKLLFIILFWVLVCVKGKYTSGILKDTNKN